MPTIITYLIVAHPSSIKVWKSGNLAKLHELHNLVISLLL